MSTLPSEETGVIAETNKVYLPLYKVLLHNDDVNTQEHVVLALIKVFRFSGTRAAQIMLEAHKNGTALCAVEPLEQAELHRDQLTSFSLVATLEPA